MDNFNITITSQGKRAFDHAIAACFIRDNNDPKHDTTAIRSWGIYENTLVLFWSEKAGQHQLPPLKVEAATTFAWEWFKEQKPTNPHPDMDGHAEDDAFCIFTNTGHHYNPDAEDGKKYWYEVPGADRFYVVFALRRTWALYGK